MNKTILVLLSLVGLIVIYIVVSGVYIIYQASKVVPCEQLPTEEEVNQILAEHPNEVQQISDISLPPAVDTFRCPGKADILINYETDKDRTQIKKIIGNDFFDVPYRMSNN